MISRRYTHLLLAPALALAAPALAQDEATGELAVDATLAGATVYVDYQEVGQTPLKQQLPPGRYKVRVAIDGYQPFVRSVDVVQDEVTELKASLVVGPGSVEFVVEPSGAEIRIDGSKVGTAPIRLADVPRGRHEYTILAENYDTIEGNFDFASGQNLLLVSQMDDITGQFRFDTDPQGAELYLDGKRVGVSPLTLDNVDPDIHLVRAELKGHATVIRTVDTSSGGLGELSARLDDRHATQVLSGGRDDTVWTVAGQRLGEGRSLTLTLDRGTYPLVAESPGYKPAAGTLIAGVQGREAWKIALEPVDSSEDSQIAERTPLVKNWIFWTAVGVVATGGGVGAAVALQPAEPAPLPSGDVAASLP